MEYFISQFNFEDYSKDIKNNIKTILKNDKKVLTDEEVYGIVISCLHAKDKKSLIETLISEVKIDENHVRAAKGASTLMAMNNIYYRGRHWLNPAEDYRDFKQGLRMMFYTKHNVEQRVFEMYALAVSFINGCEFCVGGHTHGLVNKEGVTPEQIHEILRIASVTNALCTVKLHKHL